MAGDGAVVRPVAKIAGGFGAEAVRLRQDADPSEIQTVRVPAGLKGGIGLDQSIRVQTARLVKKVEARVVQMHQFAAKRVRELGASQTMAVVTAFVDAA